MDTEGRVTATPIGHTEPMAERLLTPSKITAWLDCAHFLTLQHEVEAGVRTVESSPFGEMAQMLLDKGLEHERAVLERYRAEGLSVFEVPEWDKQHESFQQWVDRVGDVLADGHDVVFQMPFVHEGIRGIADFLRRVDDADGGGFTWEPIDAKLARNAAKPGHVLQLCFYAEAIEASTGRLPELLRIELGSGRSETVRVADVLAYWRRLRGQLATLLTQGAEVDTRPKPCDHCQFCEFELVCEAQWRAADSLVHVAGLRSADRLTLQQNGVTTIAALAELDRDITTLDAARRDTFVRQARLQVQARNAPDEKPPFELLETRASTDPLADDLDARDQIGFAALPAPDDGDVFLDFEGHPFWHADAELFFLFGLIERSPAGAWEFKGFWAHTKEEEAVATKALIDHLTERRAQFPDMHVYHYNHTERSSLERLVKEHGVAELALEQLITTGQFVDLLPIVKGAMQVGVEGYGLKHIERLTDYERGHDIDKGSGAVVEYEAWMRSKEQPMLDRIAAYNEDDVRATRELRDWLVTQRPAGMPWRPAVLGRDEPDAELDARIEALHAFGPGSVEHLLGDLLGYWRRERRVVSADAYRLSIADEVDQFESLSAITRLTFQGFEPQVLKNGKPAKWPWARFTFPTQPIDVEITRGSKLIVAVNEQEWVFFTVAEIDADAGRLGGHVGWRGRREGDLPVVARPLRVVPRRGEAHRAGGARRRDAGRPGRPRRPCDPAPRPSRVRARWRTRGWRVRRRCRRHLQLGHRAHPQLRADPGAAGDRQDVHRRPHDPHARQRRPAGGGHGDEPRRDRQPDGRRGRTVRGRGRLGEPAGGPQGEEWTGRRAAVRRRQPAGGRGRLQRDRRHDVAVRQPGDARQRGRRAGGRRGGPARPRRHVGGDDLGDQRDPARRSAAACAGVEGQPPGRRRCERARASAGRRPDGATRSWRAVGDDVADASRRVRVHLRGDVRRQAAQPRDLRWPVGCGPDRSAVAACRAQGPLHRVARGGRRSSWRRWRSCSASRGPISTASPVR
jgi:predicted RecB family nuclease